MSVRTEPEQIEAADEARVEAGAARARLARRLRWSPRDRARALGRDWAFTLRRLLAAGDSVALAAALAVAIVGVGPAAHAGERFLLGLVAIPGLILLFRMYGLYDRDGKRVSHSTVDDVPWLFHALVLGTLGMWALYKIGMPDDRLIMSEIVTFFVAAFAAVVIMRVAVRSIAVGATEAERVLLIGGGPMTHLLVRKIRSHPEYGLDPVGYVDVEAAPSDRPGGLPYLGGFADLEQACRAGHVDHVVALAGAMEHEELVELVRRMRGSNVRVSLVPDLVDVLGPSVEVDDIEGITVLGLNPPKLNRSSRAMKRAMDLVVTIPILLCALPVMAITALAVKLTSKGPILYSQERVGRRGRKFRVHKFRTMVEDAEERGKELATESRHPVWLLLDHDPRITRIGRHLRRTSLDELPQLFNVLKGEMSLVGPRPMPTDVHDQIAMLGREDRVDLTPGVTGLWQVLGRTAIPFEEMVKLDYLYATNWSLWNDTRLLIRTLPAVLRGRGAN